MPAAVYAGCLIAELTIPAGVTISATTNAGGPTAVTITPGTYTITELLTQIDADLTSQRSVSGGSWFVTSDLGTAGAIGQVAIGVTNGTFSITWTSTDLRDLLGFTATITAQTNETGTNALRGAWVPDCPLFTESYWLSAPRKTDVRRSETPTGLVYGHIGNVKYVHPLLRYSHVPVHKVWIEEETVAGESLEQFLRDTQWSEGVSWFATSSRVLVIGPDGASNLGGDTADLWSLKEADSMESVVRRIDEWDGRWICEFSNLVSSGE